MDGLTIIITRPDNAGFDGAEGGYDGQLGNRVVVIAGTARSQSWVSGASFIRNVMISALQAHRIGAPAVRVSMSGYTVNFEVEVDALDQHSNETVRQLVQRALDEAVYEDLTHTGYVVGPYLGPTGTYKLLTNVATYVRSGDDRTTNAPSTITPSLPNIIVNTTNPNNPSGNSNVPDRSGANFLNSGLDLSSLGLGVVSGGVVALVLGLIVIKGIGK